MLRWRRPGVTFLLLVLLLVDAPAASTSVLPPPESIRQVGLPVTLSGQVTDALGAPLQNQQVVLTAPGNSSVNTLTNVSGGYSFTTSAGDYSLSLNGLGNPPAQAVPAEYSLIHAGFPLDLTADTTLNLQVPAHRVTVTVLNPSSAPVSGVQLTTN